MHTLGVLLASTLVVLNRLVLSMHNRSITSVCYSTMHSIVASTLVVLL